MQDRVPYAVRKATLEAGHRSPNIRQNLQGPPIRHKSDLALIAVPIRMGILSILTQHTRMYGADTMTSSGLQARVTGFKKRLNIIAVKNLFKENRAPVSCDLNWVHWAAMYARWRCEVSPTFAGAC